jgi:hypothetical protein
VDSDSEHFRQMAKLGIDLVEFGVRIHKHAQLGVALRRRHVALFFGFKGHSVSCKNPYFEPLPFWISTNATAARVNL